MILRYRLLAERLRVELQALQRVVARTEGAVALARKRPAEQDYFLGSAALDLHAFYTGVERMLELIASDLDESRPTTPHWHHDLLAQMSLAIPDMRPAVLRAETSAALTEYLEFRHVVRNVYTFNLRPDRVAELVKDLRPTYRLVEADFLGIARFLDAIAVTPEPPPAELPGDLNQAQ
jgi:hypothetical protein